MFRGSNRRSILIGNKCGRLTLIRDLGLPPGSSNRRGIFRCDCGNEHEATLNNVVRGQVSSCGCLHKERIKASNSTHGMSATPEHGVWLNILTRIFNRNNRAFKYYGARGIDMDPRWKEDFAVFFSDMGARPTPKHTIERNDNERGYWPDNCRWATRTEQMQNMRSNRRVTLFGESVVLAEAARRLGLKRGRIATCAKGLGITAQQYVDQIVKHGPSWTVRRRNLL